LGVELAAAPEPSLNFDGCGEIQVQAGRADDAEVGAACAIGDGLDAAHIIYIDFGTRQDAFVYYQSSVCELMGRWRMVTAIP